MVSGDIAHSPSRADKLIASAMARLSASSGCRWSPESYADRSLVGCVGLRRMAWSASPHHTSSRSLRSIPSRAFERRGGVVTFLENCTRHVPEVVDGMFRTSVSGFDGTMRERSVVGGTMIEVDERISGKLVGECAHSGSEE